MEVDFQLLDADYNLINNQPVIRLFGKTQEGKTVCAFFNGFLPYFYVLPAENSEEELVGFLNKNFDQKIAKIKEVERFLPLGYSKNKTKMLELIVKSPVEVTAMREELKKQKFIREVFEADILFKYRFMADYNLSGMKWIKAIGEIAKTSTVKPDIKITASSLTPVENESNIPLKYLSIDIEVVPGKEGLPDSLRDQISMVSMAFSPSHNGQKSLVLVAKMVKQAGDSVLAFNDEKKMLEETVKIINSFDPDVICGYNINNFDMPYIVDRMKANRISAAMGRCNSKPADCRKLGIGYRNSIIGRFIVDVYDLIKESVGKGQLRLKRLGLGDVSKELLNQGKIDIAHSEIGRHWNGDEMHMKKLIDYSRKDAELTLDLLLSREMLEKFIELSKVSGLLLQDALDGGESTRVENLLLREFDKRGFVIPCRPSEDQVKRRMAEREAKGLTGALVLDPAVGLHVNSIVYLDFKSMYPSIFIAWNICPTTLIKGEEDKYVSTPYGAKFVTLEIRKGILPQIVGKLIEERDNIKKQMKGVSKSEVKFLDAKQYALKIMANAFYGYTGYTRARFYVLDIANAITSCGRDLIQKTKKIVEANKEWKVIYGDTDSVMVKLDTSDLDEALKVGKLVEERINQELSGIVKIKIENVFKSILILSKKRYAAWAFEKTGDGWADTVLMKGIETVRRDWCDLTSATLYSVLDILLKEQDTKKAFNHVKKILTGLESNQIPVEQLVITKSISKPLHSYKGVQPHIELVKKLTKRSPGDAPGVGDRVGFVITKGLKLISERAEDPEFVKQNKIKIDSKYYIESQVLPPLERVFECIGVSKSELIGIGKQMLLSSMIKPDAASLQTVEGVICDKCSKTFRRSPLLGRCTGCGGELSFYFNDAKSRFCEL